jgi:chitinase
LSQALSAFTPRPLLTAATASQPALFAALQEHFDQINLMTYDLSGAWAGWVTWFNSPIYDGGYRFPSTGGLVPSCDGMADAFMAAGVAPARLAIGIPFYGYLWAGGAGTLTGGAALPRQSWTNAPIVTAVDYADILSKYYTSNLYRWDDAAQAAYLSMDKPGSTNDAFISYDDEHACQAKVSYVRNQGLGGVMIWELGEGYLPNLPAGQQAPLLQAVKEAIRAVPDITSIRRSGQDLQLDFATLALGLYRVEWTGDPKSGLWNTLSNGVPGTGGVVQVMDPGVFGSQPRRFYRVQTPP